MRDVGGVGGRGRGHSGLRRGENGGGVLGVESGLWGWRLHDLKKRGEREGRGSVDGVEDDEGGEQLGTVRMG